MMVGTALGARPIGPQVLGEDRLLVTADRARLRRRVVVRDEDEFTPRPCALISELTVYLGEVGVGKLAVRLAPDFALPLVFVLHVLHAHLARSDRTVLGHEQVCELVSVVGALVGQLRIELRNLSLLLGIVRALPLPLPRALFSAEFALSAGQALRRPIAAARVLEHLAVGGDKPLGDSSGHADHIPPLG